MRGETAPARGGTAKPRAVTWAASYAQLCGALLFASGGNGRDRGRNGVVFQKPLLNVFPLRGGNHTLPAGNPSAAIIFGHDIAKAVKDKNVAGSCNLLESECLRGLFCFCHLHYHCSAYDTVVVRNVRVTKCTARAWLFA